MQALGSMQVRESRLGLRWPGLLLALLAATACGESRAGGSDAAGSVADAGGSPDATVEDIDSGVIADAAPERDLERVGVEPGLIRLVAGSGERLRVTAIAEYADGTRLPVPAAWSSADPEIAAVSTRGDGSGDVIGVSAGYTSLYVSAEGQSTSASVTVVDALGLDVVPDDLWVAPELSDQLGAVSRFSDERDEDVTELSSWSVDDPRLGAISDEAGSKGLFAAIRSGQTTATASYAGQTASATIHVMPIRLIGRAGEPFPAPNQDLQPPLVAMDGRGAATAGWAYGGGQVFAAGHDGTDWTERVRINPGQQPRGRTRLRALAAGQNGARVQVWTGANGLYATYARPNEPFGNIRVVPTRLPNFGRFEGITAATVTDVGDAILLWWGNGQSFVSRFSAAENRWLPPFLLPVVLSQAAFNGGGDAAVTWFTYDPSTQEYTLRSGLLAGSADLQAETVLDASAMISASSVSLNDRRDIVVAWAARPDGDTFYDHVHAANHSASLGWHTNRVVSARAIMRVDGIRTANNGSGQATVVWSDNAGLAIHASRYTPASGWEPTATLADDLVGTPQVFSIFVAASGNAITFVHAVAFSDLLPFKYLRYGVGQGWSEPEPLQHAWRGPLVANGTLSVSYNRAGQGVLAWDEDASVPRENGGTYLVEYNFMELAPPVP
jgi:hypothetical protein